MTFDQIKTQDKAYILPTYGRVDVALVQGKNARGLGRGREGVHRLHRRHRGQRPGLQRPGVGRRRSGPGREDPAPVQLLLQPREHRPGPGAVPGRGHGQGLLLQLRRRGQRVRCQGGPQIRGKEGRLPDRHFDQFLPRPHPHHPGRHRPGGLPPGLPAPHPGLPLRRGRGPARHRQAAGRLRLCRAAGDGPGGGGRHPHGGGLRKRPGPSL